MENRIFWGLGWKIENETVGTENESVRTEFFFLVLKITIAMGQIINLWNYIDPWI